MIGSIENAKNWLNNHKKGVAIGLIAAVTLIFATRAYAASSSLSFQITTYNTLAPTYASQGGGAWYAHIDPSVMLWENRQEALIEHIRAFDSDILCLQEVEPEFFDRLTLELDGYVGSFVNRSGLPGEAIFWRDSFQCIESTSVVLTTVVLHSLSHYNGEISVSGFSMGISSGIQKASSLWRRCKIG